MLQRKLTPERILSKVDDYNIFRHYFGEFEVGSIYNSKFREDKYASTGFYLSKKGSLIYNDLATGEKLNCFNFVSKLYGLSYADALKKIATDFGIIQGSISIEKPVLKVWNPEEHRKEPSLIQVKANDWTVFNLDYWNDYHITEKELILNDVYSVKYLTVNGKTIPNPQNHFRYAYMMKEGDKVMFKIYCPYEPEMKWISSIPNKKPFGIKQLPKLSKTLIISKSQKDRIVLKKYFSDVIAVQSENKHSLTEEDIYWIQDNYEKAYLFFDNDKTGILSANQIADTYMNFKPLILDTVEKDPADLVKTKGLESLERFLKDKQLI